MVTQNMTSSQNIFQTRSLSCANQKFSDPTKVLFTLYLLSLVQPQYFQKELCLCLVGM